MWSKPLSNAQNSPWLVVRSGVTDSIHDAADHLIFAIHHTVSCDGCFIYPCLLACWVFCPELAFFKKRSLALKKSLLVSGWMHLGNHSHSVYVYIYIHSNPQKDRQVKSQNITIVTQWSFSIFLGITICHCHRIGPQGQDSLFRDGPASCLVLLPCPSPKRALNAAFI